MRTKLISLGERKKILEERIASMEDRNKEISSEVIILDEVIKFFQKTIEKKTEDDMRSLESLLNSSLSYVLFDQDVRVKFTSSVKNNRVAREMVIIKDGIEGSVESVGGGVVSIISMIMRLYVHQKDKQFPLLVFDESLSMISESYRQRTSDLLKRLAKEFDLYIVLITHIDFFADHTYMVDMTNGVSRVKRV